MSKFCSLLLLTLITPCFAQPCVYNWSCFKLLNQYDKACSIVCHNALNGSFEVEAAGGSRGSTQFDISLSDGLGYPTPEQLYCEINFADGEKSHRFNFYNPFWGPSIEFKVLSASELSIDVSNRWPPLGQRHYEFRF